MMRVTALALPEVLELVPQRAVDARGFFSETWNDATFRQTGLTGALCRTIMPIRGAAALCAGCTTN